jgi:hypothetical protein
MAPFAHTIGSRYEETKDLDIAELAKIVRKDIAAAKETGDLPKNAKYSVRIERYSMSQAINVSVTINRSARKQYDPLNPRSYGRNPEASAIVTTIRGFLDSLNYDNSDPMTDYYCERFHTNVTVAGTED